MPEDDILSVSSNDLAPKEDKEKTRRESEQLDRVSETIAAIGNSATAMLLNPDVSDGEGEMLDEVQRTTLEIKSALSLTKDVAAREATGVDGVMLNNLSLYDNGEQETKKETAVEVNPQMMGEQAEVMGDPNQANYDVIPVPDRIPMQQAPANSSPAFRKGWGFRFIKGLMSAISSCLLVKTFTKWGHKANSVATLTAARRKAEQLGQRVDTEIAGVAQEAQGNPQHAALQDEQNTDFRTDSTSVPMVWEKMLGAGTQQPAVEAHVNQNTAGDRSELGANGAHSFLVLRYSKADYRTGRMHRYRLAFGIYPRFDVSEESQVSLSITIPAALQDESRSESNTGRSYNITDEQVNAIINEAPKEVDRGYNKITRNCTTFVVNMLKLAGVADSGIKEEYLDIGSDEKLLPFAAVKAAYNLGDMRATMLRRMGSKDTSYARQGQQLVTYRDMVQFEQSLQYGGAELVGYGPGMLGEQLRTINAQDSTAGQSVSIAHNREIYNVNLMKQKVDFIKEYRQHGDSKKVEGIESTLLEPIRQFLQTVSSAISSPLVGEDISPEQQVEALVSKRMDFEEHTEHFDEEKQGLSDAVRAWMGTLDVTDKGLLIFGEGLIGLLEASEVQFYEMSNASTNRRIGIGQDEDALDEVLEAKGVFSNADEKNPLFLKSFAEVFGSQSYADVMNIRQEGTAGKSKKEAAALTREKNIIRKKMIAVGDLVTVEQYKLRTFTRQASFTQEQMNELFGQAENESPTAMMARYTGQAHDEQIQELRSLAVLSRVFPNAKREIDATLAPFQKAQDSRSSAQQIVTGNQGCAMCVGILKHVNAGVHANADGLLLQVAHAMIHKLSTAPPNQVGSEEVTRELLRCIFLQHYGTLSAGTILPQEYLAALAGETEFPEYARESERYGTLSALYAMVLEQIRAIASRALA